MGREATPFRNSDRTPFFPKERPLASRRALSVLAEEIARRPSSTRSAIRSIVSGKEIPSFLTESCLGGIGKGAESFRVVDSQIREDLPVDLDAGFLQPEDELAVREPVLARGGVHPGDPERPELPLLRAPIAVGVLQGSDRSLLSRGLEVRQQAPNRFFVGRVHQRGLLEVPFPLSRFPGQDVALSRLVPPDTASSRGGEPFRRAAVALHFRHYRSSCFSAGAGSFFSGPRGAFPRAFAGFSDFSGFSTFRFCAFGATIVIIVLPSIFGALSILARSATSATICFSISNPLCDA